MLALLYFLHFSQDNKESKITTVTIGLESEHYRGCLIYLIMPDRGSELLCSHKKQYFPYCNLSLVSRIGPNCYLISTSYLAELFDIFIHMYYFIILLFDRTLTECVLVTFYQRRHVAMLVLRNLNLISI